MKSAIYLFIFIYCFLFSSNKVLAQNLLEYRNHPLNQHSFYFSEEKVICMYVLNRSDHVISLCGDNFKGLFNRMPDGSLRFLFTGAQHYYGTPRKPYNNDEKQFYSSNSCTSSHWSVLAPNIYTRNCFDDIDALRGEYTFYYKNYHSDGDTLTGRFDFKIVADVKKDLVAIQALCDQLDSDTSEAAYRTMALFLDTSKNVYKYKIASLYFPKFFYMKRSRKDLLAFIDSDIEFGRVFQSHTNTSTLARAVNVLSSLYQKEYKWYENEVEIEDYTKKIIQKLVSINKALAYHFVGSCHLYQASVLDGNYANPNYMAKNWRLLIHKL